MQLQLSPLAHTLNSSLISRKFNDLLVGSWGCLHPREGPNKFYEKETRGVDVLGGWDGDKGWCKGGKDAFSLKHKMLYPKNKYFHSEFRKKLNKQI